MKELSFKSEEELIEYIKENVLFTQEVLELLGCSRQALNQAGKPAPIKKNERYAIYLKSQALERKKELEESRKKYGKKG